MVCLYVDDLLVTGESMNEIEGSKKKMKTEYDMTDLGRLSYFLGLEFTETTSEVFLHQKRYVSEVLKRFNMMNCNSTTVLMTANLKLTEHKEEKSVDASLYKQIMGSLRYICNSRPDISYRVGILSRYMSEPKQTHLLAAKHILRYLKGTINYSLMFTRMTNNIGSTLEVWCDSDWSGYQIDRRSTFGYFVKFAGAPISWCSKKQSVVTLSSCEAEYMASAETTCQCLWLEALLKDLKIECRIPIQLMVDNKSAINLSKNQVFHGRSKHIGTKFHFLKNLVNQGRIELLHCLTDVQIADIFTKALRFNRFEALRDMLNVKTF
ncbi:uncharacterized protein LOC106779347 [Vigna radiata var. radiata]|uniref:Uncharacterized protein LOC106779347 n=1 Tax=Vigna radiata var. radiata TaxID=3916 RepID=A0A1S3VX07_VIGRR|nr:uncharacterized protein LOC106779347 [Vigna radiata var. radiata]